VEGEEGGVGGTERYWGRGGGRWEEREGEVVGERLEQGGVVGTEGRELVRPVRLDDVYDQR